MPRRRLMIAAILPLLLFCLLAGPLANGHPESAPGTNDNSGGPIKLSSPDGGSTGEPTNGPKAPLGHSAGPAQQQQQQQQQQQPVRPPSASAGPESPPGSQAAQRAERLAATLERQRKALNIPGLSATIVFADGSRWSSAAGMTDVRTPIEATPETPFVIGSITKTYVAALILKLAEEGRIGLDDKLIEWLPDYANASTITIAQLLSHTSGLANYFDHRAYDSTVFRQPERAWTPEQIIASFDRPTRRPPGANFSYSNTGYILLGLVAEAAGEAPLEELFRHYLWQPLGLTQTFAQHSSPPPVSSARGYLWNGRRFTDVGDDSGWRPTRSAATVAWAAGGLVATSADVADWMRALYGGRLLAPDLLAQMTDWDRYGEYALGTRTRIYDGRQLIGHSGSLRGYVATGWYIPTEDAAIAVLSNRGRIDAYAVANALLRQAFDDIVAPATPKGLAGLINEAGVVTVAWRSVHDNRLRPVSYRLWRDGELVAETTVPAFSEPLLPGIYGYTVAAGDTAGNWSEPSVAISIEAGP